MKKIIFVIMFISMSFILFNACNKNEVMNSKSQNLNEQSFKDAQLEKRIIAFRDKIDLIRENSALKSGTDPMDIDSTVWYIEATSNLTYGDASFDNKEFVVDSAFIEIPVTNGQILWEDVQIAYDQIIDSLSAHNDNITANEKQLIIADISLKETDDNTVIVEVTSGFGTDGDGYPWNNDHYWYWGCGMGTCDGSGHGAGLDATFKIAQLANLTISVPGGNAYYTNPFEIEVWYNEVPTTSNPFGYGNYLLYQFYEEVTMSSCLSPDAISYYKNGLITIGGMYKPEGYSVIRYLLWYDFMAGITPNGDDYWYEVHTANIKYAIWHSSGNPPEEF